MEAQGVSQTALARALGRAQNTVSTWVAGDAAPPPDVVFDVEHHLRLAPGSLSRHLGYVPAPMTDEPVVDAVEADPRLTDDQRDTLIALFRQFTASGPPEPGR